MKIERILVAVDASPHSLAALDAAAALAARQRAELVGIFVEDADLLRLAELPFAREMIYPLTLGRPINPAVMEARLKDLAELARRAIAESALRAGVDWSFRVRRGPVLNELLAAAEDSGLLVLGKASHIERRRRVRLGTTAANLLARAPKPVLVLQHGEFCRGPPLLVCDGSPASLTGLAGASESAAVFGGSPVVLLLARDRKEAAALKQKIEGTGILKTARFRRCAPSEGAGLVRIAHEEEIGVVILSGLPLGIAPEDLPEMLDKIDCPVLCHR